MKSRLQTREFFVPVTGSNTEMDPRLPRQGSLVVENGDFTLAGSIRERDALAAYIGTEVAAGTGDNSTALTTGNQYMATHGDGESIIFFGNTIVKASGPGAYSNVYDSTNLTDGGPGTIVDIYADHILQRSTLSVTRGDDFSLARTGNSAAQESDFMVASKSTGAHVFGSVYVVGESSRVQKYSLQTSLLPCIIDTGSNAEAYVICLNVADFQSTIIKWDQSSQTATETKTSASILTGEISTVYASDATFVGTINSTKRAAVAYITDEGSGPIVTVENIDIENAVQKAVATPSVTGTGDKTQISVHPWDTANNQVMVAYATNTATNIYVQLRQYTLTDTGLTLDASGSKTITAGTDAIPWHLSIDQTNDTTGTVLVTYRGRDSSVESRQLLTTDSISITGISAGTISLGTPDTEFRGVCHPISAFFTAPDSHKYQVWQYAGARWWDNDDKTPIDQASVQNFKYLVRYGSSDYKPILVGSFLHNHPWGNNDLRRNPSRIRSYVDATGTTRYATAETIWTTDTSASGIQRSAATYLADINFNRQDLRAVEVDGVTVIPNSVPYIYDGAQFYPAGPVEYAEGITAKRVASGGSFGNAGGPGAYTYSVTFVRSDALGREIESAPSPPVTTSITANADSIVVSVPFPSTLINSLDVGNVPETAAIRIYRSEVNGSSLFLTHTRTVSTSDVFTNTYSYTDTGADSFSSTQGGVTVFTAKSLYTNLGELLNVQPKPHRTGCAHQDRYFYVDRQNESSLLYYTKSVKPGISVEFADELQVTCPSYGGRIFALASYMEKLWIFKRNNILLTYGEPLNDFGSGSGYQPPRLVSRSLGVKRSTALAVGDQGIYFVNASDGDIYLIGQDERPQGIGGAVKYYTGLYEYTNALMAPQNSCVIFTSQNASAPSLAYNYEYGQWSTYTGRYSGGIYDAVSARVGSPFGLGSSPLNVVLATDRKTYIQEPNNGSTYATDEPVDVSVDFGWISLNDILGYGRFYRWTALLGKPVAGSVIDFKTAYDYDPAWVDTQTVNTTATIQPFAYTEHYSMTNSALVDQSLKIEIDGSRHKTDAVRLYIGSNASTTRNSLEILGARLEVGMRQGGSRLSGNRTVG